jgi:hypothetical protein
MTKIENDTPQSERRAILRNDRKAAASTYLDHAIAMAEMEAQGRFKRETASQVVGVPQYPAASPSHADPTGPEPLLGWDVNALEPVGSPAEVERSIREAAAALPPAAVLGAVVAAAPAPEVNVNLASGAAPSTRPQRASSAVAVTWDRPRDGDDPLFPLETERRA